MSIQLLNKTDDPGHFTEDDVDFLHEVAAQIGGLVDMMLRREEMAHRNELLEAQMERLSGFEHLVEDRTVINTVFKYTPQDTLLGRVRGHGFVGYHVDHLSGDGAV